MAYSVRMKLEALALLRQGIGVREVARRLDISPGTVVNWRDEDDRYPPAARPSIAAIAASSRRTAASSQRRRASSEEAVELRDQLDQPEPVPPSRSALDMLLGQLGAARPAPRAPRGGWVMLDTGQVVWNEHARPLPFAGPPVAAMADAAPELETREPRRRSLRDLLCEALVELAAGSGYKRGSAKSRTRRHRA